MRLKKVWVMIKVSKVRATRQNRPNRAQLHHSTMHRCLMWLTNRRQVLCLTHSNCLRHICPMGLPYQGQGHPQQGLPMPQAGGYSDPYQYFGSMNNGNIQNQQQYQ